MLLVVKSFSQQFGSSLLSFQAGAQIGDPVLEEELMRTGAPVQKVKESADLIQCPHCKRKFTVRQAVDGED